MGNTVIPNLIQGVSQQSPQQRRDSQCEAQVNCFNSPSDGCGARPHFDFVSLYAGLDWSDAYFAAFFRDDEEYVLGVSGNVPFARNLATGAVCTVTQTAGTGYLATGTDTDAEQVRMQAVEDTVFVLNRAATPAMDAGSVTPTASLVAYVVYNSGYGDTAASPTIQLDAIGNSNTTGTLTPDPGGGTDEPRAMANAVVSSINANTATHKFVAERKGSVVRISRTDTRDFSITFNDGFNANRAYAFKESCPSFEKLPYCGWNGDIIKVIGESRTKEDDYYVQWVASNTTDTDGSVGVWEEVVGPNTETDLDPATMPHTLVNTGLNTFEYKQATWSSRIAGDAESAPDPSFIGGRVQDIFYYDNRLGLLLVNGAVWSKAKFPYTMFPDTVQTVLADAPIDTDVVRSPDTQGSYSFDYPVSFDEGLYLWANRAQFRVLTGDDNLFKAGGISIKRSTAYEYARAARPASVGQTLYSASENGVWAKVRALLFSSGRIVGGIDVTAHVKRYIPSGVHQVVASDTFDCLFVLTSGDPDALYLYNLLLSGQEYIQSAHSRWEVPGGNILWAGLSGNKLRILQQRAEGVALLSCNLTPQRVDDVAGAEYLTRLDLRVDQDGVTGLTYDAGTDTTSFTLPYTPTLEQDLRVITAADKTGGYTRGREFAITDITGAVVTVTGDLTGYDFYVGHRVVSLRQESEFYIRTDKGITPTERLVVSSYTLEMSDTGYTRIEVSSPNKDTRAYAYEGRTSGLATSATETAKLGTAKLRAPVNEVNTNCTITLINDSYLPSYWQTASIDYVATYPVGKGGTVG